MRRTHPGAAGGWALAGLASAACHVVVQSETTRPVATERILHREGAIAHRPTLPVTDAGWVRFVEPLECPTEEITRQHTTTELATRPNLATFTVGVIDGRIIYVGKLARGAAIARELIIPLAVPTAAALRGQAIELSVELRDAHGTAPATPVRFRGAVLGDPPR